MIYFNPLALSFHAATQVGFVAVQVERYAEIVRGQASGMVVVADVNNQPVLTSASMSSFATLRVIELAKYRLDRELFLNRIAGIMVAFADDVAVVAAGKDMRQGLLDLPSHPTVVGATEIAQLRLAIRSRYGTLVAAMPLAARTAFKKVDQ